MEASHKTSQIEPSPGVLAVAQLLRQRYLLEHETDAPVSDWYLDALEIVQIYREAEGDA